MIEFYRENIVWIKPIRASVDTNKFGTNFEYWLTFKRFHVFFLETKPDWQFHRAVDVVSIKWAYWNYCNNIWESIKSHLFWHNYYSSTRFNQNQTALFLSQLKIEQNLEKTYQKKTTQFQIQKQEKKTFKKKFEEATEREIVLTYNQMIWEMVK